MPQDYGLASTGLGCQAARVLVPEEVERQKSTGSLGGLASSPHSCQCVCGRLLGYLLRDLRVCAFL